MTDDTLIESTEKLSEKQTTSPAQEQTQSAADRILSRLSETKNTGKNIQDESVHLEKSIEERLTILQTHDSIVQKEEEVEVPAELRTDDEVSEEEKDSSTTIVDYSGSSKQELVEKLKTLLETRPVQELRTDVESIKLAFYKLRKEEINENRQKFLDEGGVIENFVIEVDPLEAELKELYKKYRDLKTARIEEIERNKQENLKAKYQIVEELKELINKKESINQTFGEFRDLQRRWREIGVVPQVEVKVLWETYHYHVEKFYDYININKELRDLDLKKNLEIKITLCEKAEELLLEPMVVKAFRSLQKYHTQWREIGPVPREKREEIWERFKEATNKINKKHQEHFEGLKSEQDNNLKAKVVLCEKAEEISNLVISSHKEWDEKSKEMVELQKVWRLIGFAPRKENTKVFNRFRNACDAFFGKKREFYGQAKEEQNNNLQLKTDLCIQAEGLKDSTDWKKTTELFIALQEKWKTIGPVPRKFSDSIWKRFRTACNSFFERKNSYFSNIDSEQQKNLEAKRALIEEIKAYQVSNDNEDNLTKLKEFQKRWTEIGHVPIKFKDEIQKQFREEVNTQFGKLRFDDSGRSDSDFKTRIEGLQQSPKSKMKFKIERDKIRMRIQQLEGDINLWENNIGYFTKSVNAESLIDDVNKKIARAKEQVKSLRERLTLVEKIETSSKETK